VIKSLITDIPEADFDVSKGGQVEIIGWLYQYYNTEPKDIALKKKKYTESDIPAVTQLFTPDWVVKYMVQNSLGRYWINVLRAKGDSRTATEIANDFNWNYFMPSAEQNNQTVLVIEKSTTNLSDINIENISLVDAAMGSGHILVYAFEVFMQLYISEGYSQRDAAKLIIQKNLFGFDIDTRAFQLSYFALMMEARQYNRRFLTNNIQPNVSDIIESADIQTADFKQLIESSEEEQDLNNLLSIFKYGNDYGSLIHFEHQLNWNSLKRLTQPATEVGQLSFNDIALSNKQKELSQLINLAELLSRTYTIGIMNPPYMGSGKMNQVLGNYVKKNYPDSKSDLFSVFMERLQSLTAGDGYYAMITQHAWMFLSSFEKLRKKLRQNTLINMAHLGTRAFEEIGGEVVQSTTFIFKKQQISNYIGTYERLVDFNSQSAKEQAYLNAVKDTSVDYLYRTNQTNFEKIPGSPIAYWASKNLIHDFEVGTPMEKIVEPRQGLATADNKRFLRQWFEVDVNNISFHSKSISDSLTSGKKWFPCNKGGNYRKWYGNYDYVVNWENDGQEIRNFTDSNGKVRSRPQNSNYYFREAITWSDITSGGFSLRYRIAGSIHDHKGMSAFGNNHDLLLMVLGIINTKVGNYIFKILNPTISLEIGNFKSFPVCIEKEHERLSIKIATQAIKLGKADWDAFEVSWDYIGSPLLHIADDNLLIWYYSLVHTNTSAKNVPIFQLWGLK